MTTIRLTMAQALIRYLAVQTSEVDGREVPLFAGVFAIFGHGNVAGVGEALYDAISGRVGMLIWGGVYGFALGAGLGVVLYFAQVSQKEQLSM